MKKNLCRLAAGFAIAAAAITGTLTTTATAAPQGDTTSGVTYTPQDTYWGATPTGGGTATPQDTYWG